MLLITDSKVLKPPVNHNLECLMCLKCATGLAYTYKYIFKVSPKSGKRSNRPESTKPSAIYSTEYLISMRGECPRSCLYKGICQVSSNSDNKCNQSEEHLISMLNFIKIYIINSISVICLITTMQPSFGRLVVSLQSK